MDLDDYEEYMLSQSDGEDAPRSGDGGTYGDAVPNPLQGISSLDPSSLRVCAAQVNDDWL